jgi:hypothetical protein
MNKQTFQLISENFFPLLKYKNICNPNLAILFSSVPCSGKTHLSKIIEDKYKAIRINKDEIGEIILKLNLTKKTNQKEDLADQYIYYLIENLLFKNKLIVLDKSIDRTYKKTFQLLQKNILKNS